MLSLPLSLSLSPCIAGSDRRAIRERRVSASLSLSLPHQMRSSSSGRELLLQERERERAGMQRENQSSYPPDFCRHEFHSAAAQGTQTTSIPSINLPVLDLSDPIEFPAKLGEICRNWGIFRLINHGISPSLINQLRREAMLFLSLPFEIKKSRSSPSLTYFWGTPAVSINLPKINWIEGLHLPLGNPISGDDHSSSSFRDLAGEFGKQAGRVSKKIFETLAEDLDMANEVRDSIFSGPGKLLRFHRYPLSPAVCDSIGMDAHTDSSVLTLVSDGEVGGLQIFRDGAWLAVDPLSGSLLVNLGDMMQAISDDRCESVKHRVLASGVEERSSICFFVFPPEDVPIRSSRFREFTYGEFKAKVQEDVRDLGFKVGLHRFRKLES